MSKAALITGITGQDGSYLAELLLAKGYEVHGVVRRSSSFNTARIDHIFDSIQLHFGDVTDPLSIRSILSKSQPDEVYNLAAQSHVRVSFDQPVYTVDVAAMGTLHMLEAIRDYRQASGKDVRIYQASSSEMFGDVKIPEKRKPNATKRSTYKLTERSPFYPRSPYACAKVYAYYQTINYREAYGLFAANGILFNHESPRRGETFVTRKITRAVARIYHKLQSKLLLGNLDAVRDWGFAGDYVDAMWRMLQADSPSDYIVATGIPISVRAWLEMAFSFVGLQWSDYVKIDERYMRPTEVPYLCGDYAKATEELGWKPTTPPAKLCDMMMQHDLALAEEEAVLDKHRRAG